MLKIDPSAADAYVNSGSANIGLGDYSAALQSLDSTIALDPADPVAYYNRGFAHFAQGDLDLAAVDYSQALRFAPDLVDVYRARAKLFTTPGRDDAAQVNVDTVAKLGGDSGTLQAEIEEIWRQRTDA